jgi:hypothetical protein
MLYVCSQGAAGQMGRNDFAHAALNETQANVIWKQLEV